MIALHKSNQKKPATRNGRGFRRYRRRWKAERLIALLQNFAALLHALTIMMKIISALFIWAVSRFYCAAFYETASS